MESILGNFRMINETEKDNFSGRTESTIQGNGGVERNTETDTGNPQREIVTWANGIMERCLAMGFTT